ncbi:MAG: hypothetical protein ACREAF_05445 [Nitrosopumilaceae archaeon]
MKTNIIAAGAGGTAVAIAVAIIFMIQGLSEQYSIYVDPLKDPQDLFTTARVTIQNTGRATLTNVIIDYGGYSDKISLLRPGEKLIMSPPPGNALKEVTVTSDEGINVTMPYRIPTKMPGMMGS